ncbi:MAG: mechanosensitive ion channel family protein [Alphaproteobacteria bacterium]|jgi:small-conductance mechanosensitive channel|nr:mechanosensitive ion channel family protein [Alphaproteobacteria bacterium]
MDTLISFWQGYRADNIWFLFSLSILIGYTSFERRLLPKILKIAFKSYVTQEKNILILEAAIDNFKKVVRVVVITFVVYHLTHHHFLLSFVVNEPKSMAHIYFPIFLTFTFFFTIMKAIDFYYFVYEQKDKKVHHILTEEQFILFMRFLKGAIIFAAATSIFSLLGIDLTALLGGIGIMTAAVGFAAKDTIANLFGSIAVLIDKSLRKGDWIKVGDVEGDILHVGLRTTSIRQFDKSVTTLTNVKLAEGPVTNYSKMTHRKVDWSVGLRYDTPSHILEKILHDYHQYLDAHPGIVTKEKNIKTITRAHDFGEYAIKIQLYFFTKTTDSTEYMRIKEECLLTFKKLVEENGASFAYPTRSIHLEQSAQDLLNK